MFQELSREDEITAFFEDVLQDESDNLRRRLVSMLARLDVSDWEELERIARKMVHGKEDAAPAPRWTEEEHARWEAEARAEADEVYRQILQEKRAAAESLALPPDGGEYGPGGGRLA